MSIISFTIYTVIASVLIFIIIISCYFLIKSQQIKELKRVLIANIYYQYTSSTTLNKELEKLHIFCQQIAQKNQEDFSFHKEVSSISFEEVPFSKDTFNRISKTNLLATEKDSYIDDFQKIQDIYWNVEKQQ